MKLKARLRNAKAARVSIATQSSRGNGVDVIIKHKSIRKCLRFMAQNFSAPIQVKDMVRIASLSRRGFCKAFKRNVGVNPGTFLRQLRIEHAKRLLAQQNLRLREIAPKCGYRRVNTFSVAFSREVRMAPKEFQRRYRLVACRDLK